MEITRPGLTVVIPVHNRAQMVAQTVRDIMAQTRKPEAVVLVDNASTDGTEQVLRTLARECEDIGIPATVLSEPTPGACAARNRGLRAVDTEWVMFFDSDDAMAPRHIADAMAEADAQPRADIIGWDIYHERDGHKSVHPFASRRHQYHNIMNGAMATQRYMTRTSLARAVGGWDNNVKIWNDIEFGARLLSRASSVVYRRGIPAVTVRIHPQSITGSSYSSRSDAYAPALRALARTLGPRRRAWVLFKAIILAADISREGSELGPAYRKKILDAAHSSSLRVILAMAYAYRHRGLRGATHLLRPFLPR